MASQFLSSLDCRQIHHNTVISQSKDIKAHKCEVFERNLGKIAYSLKDKKYVQKQHKSITTINSARKSSTATCPHKENLIPLPSFKQPRKLFSIQPQLNISIFPKQGQLNLYQTHTSMIKFNISHSPYQSCYQYDNLRSTQETQLCGAQVAGYGFEKMKDRIMMRKVISSEENGDDAETEEKRMLSKGKSEGNLLNLSERRNRQYTSVLVHDKFRIVSEAQEQQQQRSPTLHQLTASNNNHSIYLPQPLTIKKHSNNTTHDSNIPSIGLASKLKKLTEMSIRSTRSIKEEDSLMDEFSEVLVQSPVMLMGKRKVSLVERLERLER